MLVVKLTTRSQMRLSRRDRYGAVPPNNVTYAHAINVCQKAEEPDLEGAECFLRWAIDDGIQPTVFMYAPAIWAAQRSGDRAKALEYFIEMESMGCRANSVAYNGVISALCDNCDVEHALLVYEEMKDQGFKLPGPTFKVSC
jgi:pentatricopeptide repeat protein